MYVNPFWFGVLMSIVAMVVLVLIIGFVGGKIADKEDMEFEDLDEAEMNDMLNDMDGKIVRLKREGEFLAFEEIDDEEQDE